MHRKKKMKIKSPKTLHLTKKLIKLIKVKEMKLVLKPALDWSTFANERLRKQRR